MEMPEGWKRLKVLCKSERDMHFETGHAARDALDLMKEMAEALEKGLEYEDCPPEGNCKIYGHDEMRAVLKKFKEWK